jgi:hypothetical protein
VTAPAGAGYGAGSDGPDSGDLAAVYTGSWLTAAARRIAAGNQPGNLDGLFARYVLADTAVTDLNWDVNPLSPQWLEDNRERLAYAPVMAALGYGLAYTAPPSRGMATARAALATGLPRLMARDLFRDRVTFVSSSRQVLGIALAARAIAGDLPVFGGWLLDVLSDTRLQPAGRFQELIYQHVRVMLGGDPAPSDCRSADDAAALAPYGLDGRLRHRPPASISRGASRLPAAPCRRGHTYRPRPAHGPQAAVLYRAVTAVLDASIDQMVLSRSISGRCSGDLRGPCAGGVGTTIASPTRSSGR